MWKIVAVIVAIVVIVSVIAVIYLLPSKGPSATNQVPTISQIAASAETTEVGKYLTFTAQASDPDNDSLTYVWNFGDGTQAIGNFTNGQATVIHAYAISGQFISLLTVSDGRGGTVTNDGRLVFISARLAASSAAQPADCSAAPCPAGPVVPVLGALSGVSTTTAGTPITFNGNGSWAYNISWVNKTDHSQGGSYKVLAAGSSPLLFTTLDYSWGDGSADTIGTSTAVGQTTHTFASVGLYFVRLTVSYSQVDLTGTPVVASTGYSVRVLAQAPAAQVKYPDVFTYATFGEPQYLDPALDYETSGGEVLQVAYESLLTYPNNSTLTYLIPRLATTIPTVANGGISANGLNYTFNIQNNVTFHGTWGHMTATDVAFSFQRALAIHDPSGPTWMIEQVLTGTNSGNVIEYYTGKQCGSSGTSQCYVSDWVSAAFPNPANITPNILAVIGSPSTWATEALTPALAWAVSNSTVQATGQYTVVFHLTHPYPAFLAVMAFTVGSVVSQACVMANGGVQWATQNQYLNEGTDCGTGPYQISSWVHNQIIVLTRFDNYWGPKASIKEVHIVKANDIATRELMLFSGDADVADVGWTYSPDVLNADGTVKYNYLYVDKGEPTLTVGFIGFDQNVNVSNAPDPWTLPATFFADVHIRKAFSYAFDDATYIAKVLHGGAVPLNGAIPAGMLGYNPNIPYFTYDLSKAAAELQQTAYWSKGFNMTLYYNSGNTARQTSILLLAQALGALHGAPYNMPGTINIKARGLDWPVYLSTLSIHGAGAFVLGWLPDYADPDDYVLPFLHTGQTYPAWMAYSNTTLDAMIDAAAKELNQATRAQMYQTITYDASVYDVPYIWTTQATNFYVSRTWVHGWYFNAMNSGMPFYAFSKS